MTERKKRAHDEAASIGELIGITGPQLAYELLIAGLFQYLEGPRAAEVIDAEGRRNDASFHLRLREWLSREALEHGHPAAIDAMLEILERREREQQ